jgi:ribonucleoside-triphosphate reductase
MQINLTFEPEFDQLYNNYALTDKRAQLLELEGISRDKLDVGKMSYAYFTKKLADITVDQNANANESTSPNNYSAEVVKGIMKIEGYYLLWKYSKKRYGLRVANKLIRVIWDGDLYFHDPTGIQLPYCWAFSTTPLMVEGRPYGQLQSLPAKRADSFIAQVIETTMDLSQEFVGAVAPSDVLINYAWYAKKENKLDTEIINDFQKLVHVLNNKFRVSGQSPFTNISLFDRKNMEIVWKDYRYPDGSAVDVEYVMHVQKLFGSWFAKGDPATGLPYRFPVVSVNINVGTDKTITDEDFLDWLSEVNIEKGVFNIYANDGTKIASCCRLSNNFERMKFRADTLGGGGMNIGSHRVVTINLPRLGLLANKDETTFFKLLDNNLEKAKKLLLVHRENLLTERINNGNGFLKFFQPLKWFNIEHLFSTVGIVGVYEANYYMGYDVTSSQGVDFTTKLLKHIEARLEQFSDETKYSFNCEEIPAESTAVTLARKDSIYFGDYQQFRLYSNQYIPLIKDATMLERIKLSGKFMSLLSGGGILHLNMSDKIHNKEQMKHLIKVAIRNGVENFAINYGFCICEDNHVSIAGTSKHCPQCGKRITDYMTRVIGYFTKVSSWNSTRREFEYPNRKFMKAAS